MDKHEITALVVIAVFAVSVLYLIFIPGFLPLISQLMTESSVTPSSEAKSLICNPESMRTFLRVSPRSCGSSG